jgi:hypothetical protein
MGKFIKHEDKPGTDKPKRKPQGKPQEPGMHVEVTGPTVPAHVPSPSMQHDINHVAGLAGIEESLDWIAKGLNRLTADGQAISISTGYGSDPVKVTLSANDSDDIMDSLVTAFERIADSVSRLAGLNRPRVVSWDEKREY